jgi:hypothetical protein
MTGTLLGALIGLGLFLVFERKRIARWRGQFTAMRRRPGGTQNARRLSTALAAAGFFDGLAAEEAQSLRTRVDTQGYGAVFTHPWRALNADDEELAEGEVGVFLKLWAPSLLRLGLKPLVGTDRFGEGGSHYLDLEGESLMLVSEEEARNDRRDAKSGFSWGAVAARLLERLNGDAASAGISDRFYSVYAGNDADVLILTPPMLAAIMAAPGIRRDELPYLRTAEWPLFGMSTDGPDRARTAS